MKIETSIYVNNDPSYLTPSVYAEPKEYFLRIIDMIKSRFRGRPVSLVDVGCASGALLYWVSKSLEFSKLVGLDVSEEPLELAKKNVPIAEFDNYSVMDMVKSKYQNAFEVGICTGTMSIFHDLAAPLRNLYSFLKPSGVLYIFALVNDFLIDVLSQYRRADRAASEPWQSALNVRSKETYQQLVEIVDPEAKISWLDFKMPKSIPKSDDPMRAWTARFEHNAHQTVVGTGQLLNFKILTIERP